VRTSRFGDPKDVDPERFRPIAPFENNPTRWPELGYRNLHHPEAGQYRAVTRFEDHTPDTFLAQTIADVLQAHAQRPETKLLAPDGTPCRADTTGLLVRRELRIDADRITYLGKEAGELLGYPTEVAAELDDRRNIYTRADTLNDDERAVLREMGASALAELTGADRSTIHRIAAGITARPGRDLMRHLRHAIALHARPAARAKRQTTV
jgi:hypothetical protein